MQHPMFPSLPVRGQGDQADRVVRPFWPVTKGSLDRALPLLGLSPEAFDSGKSVSFGSEKAALTQDWSSRWTE